jgi:branched-chain amino acid transport system substrate-binding protein
VVIGVDLPFRGALAKQSLDTYQAMDLYLKRAGNRAGPYTVELRRYDSSTAAGERSDTATCTANARAHVAAADEIAVIGPQNSECARIQVPILNAAPGGAQLLVSHNNTSPGLTTRWDVGEPDKYYPTRVRNYARVKTTDEHQATAAAQFAKEQYDLRRCLVLHDGSPNGENLARRFATAATALDIQVSGPTRWYANRSDYTDIFLAATGDRPDCVYVGGYSSANGAQLVRDKVAVLGDNSVVRMIGSDGFSGEPLRTLPQAAGLFITTAGLVDQDLRSPGPVAEALLQAYEAQYRTRPKSASVLYGVQALQVVLAAIEKSDGTRNGVRAAVMSAPGISITATNAVLGRPLSIDPATGDVNTKMVTFLRIHGKAEVYAAAWDVD